MVYALLGYKYISYTKIKNFIFLNKIIILYFRYQKQNAQLRFNTYVFGPVIMRMYHYFNKPEEALKVRLRSLILKSYRI